MVYKKYIKRNGKVYGPYYYHSRRVNGRVVSEYRGGNAKTLNYKKFVVPVLGVLFLALLIYAGFNMDFQGISGNVVLDLGANYESGQPLSGTLDLTLNKGEFIPAESKVVFETSNKTYEYLLSDLVSEPPKKGSYFLEQNSFSGYGDGYGTPGIQIFYPVVYFDYKIYSNTDSSESSSDSSIGGQDIVNQKSSAESGEAQNSSGNSTDGGDNSTSPGSPVEKKNNLNNETMPEEGQSSASSGTEVPEVTATGASPEQDVEGSPASQETETSSEIADEQDTEVVEPAPGLPEAVSNFFLALTPTGRIVAEIGTSNSGQVTYGEPLELNLQKGQEIEIIPGSIHTNSKNLSSEVIEVVRDGNLVIITTSYFEESSGFGGDYLEGGNKTLSTDLEPLQMFFDSGQLDISVKYEEEEIVSMSTLLEQGIIETSKGELVSKEKLNNEPVVESKTNIPQQEELNLPSSLTESERAVLEAKYGDYEIEISKQKLQDGQLLITYELGENVFSGIYDATLSKEELSKKMDLDRVDWLKQIAANI